MVFVALAKAASSNGSGGSVEEALDWVRDAQFLCVALQRRMAAAIGGSTLHSAGDLQRPGESGDRKFSHSEVDNLCIQNADVRWVLVDEISMIADALL